MSDHRIRLTDLELGLLRGACLSTMFAVEPFSQEWSAAYRRLHERLMHIKAGGMPLNTRTARRDFKRRDREETADGRQQ